MYPLNGSRVCCVGMYRNAVNSILDNATNDSVINIIDCEHKEYLTELSNRLLSADINPNIVNKLISHFEPEELRDLVNLAINIKEGNIDKRKYIQYCNEHLQDELCCTEFYLTVAIMCCP